MKASRTLSAGIAVLTVFLGGSEVAHASFLKDILGPLAPPTPPIIVPRGGKRTSGIGCDPNKDPHCGNLLPKQVKTRPKL